MKEHFCPAEQSMIAFEKECNWCGEKEALAQEQEPAATLAVRWHDPVGKVAYVLEVNLPLGIHKLYPTPPQRTWVGLTDEDICMFSMWLDDKSDVAVFTAIESKLKELNT